MIPTQPCLPAGQALPPTFPKTARPKAARLRPAPLRRLALTLALALTAAPLAARAEPVQFDLVLRGITAGRLTYDGQVSGKSYAVSGRLQTTGLAALLKRVSYNATAKGSVSAAGRFTPSAYTEDADTGKRQSKSVMAYRGGVPQVTQYSPARGPREYDLDPAKQGGTVDPLTALFVTLRDVDPGQECGTSLRLFDGRRSSAVTTSNRKEAGKTVTCAGEYRRTGGFSPEDMAEKTRFPFTVTYSPGPNGQMRVTEVSMDTLYGKGRLVRR